MSTPLSTTPYYRAMNEAFARNFTTLARYHACHQGRDPNQVSLHEVRDLVADIDHLKAVVGASVEQHSTGELRASVEAEWLSEDIRDWLEQVYLPKTVHERRREVSGFISYLDGFLSTEGQGTQ